MPWQQCKAGLCRMIRHTQDPQDGLLCSMVLMLAGSGAQAHQHVLMLVRSHKAALHLAIGIGPMLGWDNRAAHGLVPQMSACQHVIRSLPPSE